jgi:hypothetical protein
VALPQKSFNNLTDWIIAAERRDVFSYAIASDDPLRKKKEIVRIL